MKLLPRLRHRAYIDCETTGLDPLTHEMLEVAILREHPTTNAVHGFRVQIRPEHLETADPKALEINGYTPEKWKNALPLAEAIPYIEEQLKDCILIGHNIRFDLDFLKAAQTKVGSAVKLDFLVMDTMTLAYEHLAPLGIPSLSLKTVCTFLGVVPGGHRALQDALACREVYHQLARAPWFRRWTWHFQSWVNYGPAAPPNSAPPAAVGCGPAQGSVPR